MSEGNNIKWERDGDLGILSLGQPPENYIVNPEFVPVQRLKDWLAEPVKALIIRGTGRHFSAGADLNAMIAQVKDKESFFLQMMKGNKLINYISELDIPVVAAVTGVCFGGGLEIALAADIRICTERSLLAFPEINHELIPGLGGLRRLERICGHPVAMELMMSGDTISARKALELKLVDHVVPGNDALEFSRNYVNGLVAGRSHKVIRMLIRSFRNAAKPDQEKALIEDVRMFCDLAMDFLEKNH